MAESGILGVKHKVAFMTCILAILLCSQQTAAQNVSTAGVESLANQLINDINAKGNSSVNPADIYASAATAAQCAARFGSPNPVSIIMVADDGTFSGTSEAVFILDFLQNQNRAPNSSTPCQQIITGTLFQQDVVVITSGIGPEAAALCVSYITQCASNIKDLIYPGTSGWSAQRGGALNAVSGAPLNSCPTPNGATPRTRLGDVAVTPYSVNWECKDASWTEQCNNFPNVCTYPVEEAGPTVSSLYGQCIFSMKTAANTALADEIIAATQSPQYAASAAGLQNTFNQTILPYETAYWNTTTQGTGTVYPAFPAYTGPTILTYNQSAELDGQFFFSGSPWEMVGRNYTAQTLNLANGGSLTQYDITQVNAEEGVGVSAALDLYNSLTGSTKIRYVFVRAASNYSYRPPFRTGTGSWAESPTPSPDFGTQYAFAIKTSSQVVLTTFQLRCLAAGNSASACAYVLPGL